MIKCKLHAYEQGEGVCASCLRDRLVVLQAAQHVTTPEIHRSASRALSSYVSHRLSNDYDTASGTSDEHYPQIRETNQHRCRSFSKLSSLFHHHHRHRSNEPKPSGSSSWFSSIVDGQRKKDPPAMRKVKTFGVLDLGNSPMRGKETGDNASESSGTLHRPVLPPRAAAEVCRRDGGVFAGFVVCLSPLVRVGPTSRRSQMEVGFSGEVRSNRVPVKNGHVSGFGGSIGPNRSRKLADCGKFR